MAYDPSGGFPTLIEIREWLQTPATVLPDAQLEKIAGAEQGAVYAGYVWITADGLPDGLYGVFMRLVARSAAAKGVPLGILAADAEYGTVRLSRFDSEVTRLGGPYRLRVFA
jgi:hypothetical protein